MQSANKVKNFWIFLIPGLLCAAILLGSCSDKDLARSTSVQVEEDVLVNQTISGIEEEWDAAEAERFQDVAQIQLISILRALEDLRTDSGEVDLKALVLAPASASVGALRPTNAEGENVFHQDGIRVMRWRPLPDQLRAIDLEAAYAELAQLWPKAATPRIAVKHFDVQKQSDGSVVTHTDFNAHLANGDVSIQQQGKWRCRWKPMSDEEGAPPLLISLQMLEFEELRLEGRDSQRGLVDITQSLLEGLPIFRDSLNRDANYWVTRLPRLKHRFQHGVAVGDVNGDGVEDVYLCQPEGLPNVLLVRQPDGSVRDAAAEFGIAFKDNTTSALLVDFDNDGDQDLAVAFRSPFDVFENVGGKFVQRFSMPALGQIFSLSAADFDADGLLDIYVCRYQNFDDLGRPKNPIPLHDARNGGENALLRNMGDWQFEDVTVAVGMGENNTRWSMAAAWEDYDADGDLDLYVANDYGRNNLYQCDSSGDGIPNYSDVAELVGVEDMTTSMGVSWGDPNRDGKADVYVSNMYSSAGRRITYQKNFKRNVTGTDEEHIAGWRRAAMGNSLFQLGSDGKFRHTSAAAKVQKGLWSWGTVFADLNHDGWEDLLVTNGFVTGPSEEQDL